MNIFKILRSSSHSKHVLGSRIPTKHIERMTGRKELNLKPVKLSTIRKFLSPFMSALKRISAWFRRSPSKNIPESDDINSIQKDRVSVLGATLQSQAEALSSMRVPSAPPYADCVEAVRPVPSAPPYADCVEAVRPVPSVPPSEDYVEEAVVYAYPVSDNECDDLQMPVLEARKILESATLAVTQAVIHVPALSGLVRKDKDKAPKSMRAKVEDETLKAFRQDPGFMRRAYENGAAPKFFRERVEQTRSARLLSLELNDHMDYVARTLSESDLDHYLQNRLERLTLSEAHISEGYTVRTYTALYLETQYMQQQLDMLRTWMGIFQQFIDSLHPMLNKHNDILGPVTAHANLSIIQLGLQEQAVYESQLNVKMKMKAMPMGLRRVSL